jgi:hypothetical protein
MTPSSVPPPVAVLQLAMGRWVSHIVGTCAELGLADEIQEGPKTAAELAAKKGLHAPSLYRLLRTLASLGIFVEGPEGRFAHTPMSDALRSDVPYSMRGMARMINRPWSIRAWTELEHSVRTGESAFEHVHGTRGFDYFTEHPQEMQIFAQAMSSFTAQVGTKVAEAYDFSPFGTLADIGGSHGMVLAIVLAKYPALKGILFDLPKVVESAEAFLASRGVAQRIQRVGGDFFSGVPKGADAYLMKHILHDWSDEDSIRILRRIHESAHKGAKLLLVEGIVSDAPGSEFIKILDIEMMAVTHGGRERTLPEWQKLISESGFSFTRVVPTESPACVIEAVRP